MTGLTYDSDITGVHRIEISQGVIGVVLAIAIVSPIRTFVGDKKVPQPRPITDVRVPFLHGFVSAGKFRHGRIEFSPSARMFGSIRRR